MASAARTPSAGAWMRLSVESEYRASGPDSPHNVFLFDKCRAAGLRRHVQGVDTERHVRFEQKSWLAGIVTVVVAIEADGVNVERQALRVAAAPPHAVLDDAEHVVRGRARAEAFVHGVEGRLEQAVYPALFVGGRAYHQRPAHVGVVPVEDGYAGARN